MSKFEIIKIMIYGAIMAKDLKSAKAILGNKAAAKKTDWNFPLNRKDMTFVLVGVGVILLGYILMATGMGEGPATPDGAWAGFLPVTLAPIMLLIGYCVIIPMAIMRFFSKKKNESTNQSEA